MRPEFVVIIVLSLFVFLLIIANEILHKRNKLLEVANDLNYQRFLQSESSKKHLMNLCDAKDKTIQGHATQINEINFLLKGQVDVDLEYAKVNSDLNKQVSDLQLANTALKARLDHKKMPTKLSWEVDNFQIG